MPARFDVPRSAGPLVTLRRGEHEFVLAPACGARIVAFRSRGRDVLRPASAEALNNGSSYGFAGFPLMPYSGPIFAGGFEFAGAWHALARNVPQEPTPTHGEGWIRSWSIAEQAPERAVLGLDYTPTAGSFPFAWRGRLGFELDERGVSISL